MGKRILPYFFHHLWWSLFYFLNYWFITLFSTPIMFLPLLTLLLTLFSFVSSFPLRFRRAPGDAQNTTNTTTGAKYVVAHHMVGNTYPYTLQDWIDDIQLAHSKSIDAFALNMGIDEWQPARIDDAYKAAEQSGNGFKLFISLDMTSFPCASSADAGRLRNIVKSHLNSPAQFKFNNRSFVSTFAGENCNFGHSNAVDGWTTEFTQHPDLAGQIYFVPAFFVDPNRFGDFHAVMDGAFAWDSGWPQKVDNQFAQQQLGKNLQNSPSISPALRVVNKVLAPADQKLSSGVIKTLLEELEAVLSPVQKAVSSFIGDTDLDSQFLQGLNVLHGQLQKRDGSGASKPTYMAAVAANFFTHYGPDTFDKNFAYLGDQHLLAKRWEAIIRNRAQYDIVQILTWNDYGESHYCGPIKGSLPKSEAWTIGFNHTAFLDVHKFYAEAFKTGAFPEITEDRLVIWSRPHAALAKAASDNVGAPKNFDLFQDNVWALAFTSAPGTVTLQTSPTSSKSFDVLRGVTKLAIPILPGDSMTGSIERNGQKVVEVAAPGFTFQGDPKTFNYNYFVAGAGSKDGSSSLLNTTSFSSPQP